MAHRQPSTTQVSIHPYTHADPEPLKTGGVSTHSLTTQFPFQLYMFNGTHGTCVCFAPNRRRRTTTTITNPIAHSLYLCLLERHVRTTSNKPPTRWMWYYYDDGCDKKTKQLTTLLLSKESPRSLFSLRVWRHRCARRRRSIERSIEDLFNLIYPSEAAMISMKYKRSALILSERARNKDGECSCRKCYYYRNSTG